MSSDSTHTILAQQRHGVGLGENTTRWRYLPRSEVIDNCALPVRGNKTPCRRSKDGETDDNGNAMLPKKIF